MKVNYFIIPLVTLIVAFIGSLLTSGGMDWYENLNLPEGTPTGSFIGAIWTVIFILATISALIFWNKSERNSRFRLIVTLFVINAFLNVFWSFLFFNQHLILASILEMIILELSVVALIVLILPISKLASFLLLPYAIWVIFATNLAYQILILNK